MHQSYPRLVAKIGDASAELVGNRSAVISCEVSQMRPAVGPKKKEEVMMLVVEEGGLELDRSLTCSDSLAEVVAVVPDSSVCSTRRSRRTSTQSGW